MDELGGLVLGEIENVIGCLGGGRSFRRMLLRPIEAQAGSRSKPVLRRSFLSLVVCRALCGQAERAVPAAAALELFVAALDVLDDIEDGDTEYALLSANGQAQVTNAATALLMLAPLAIARSRSRGIDELTIARAMQAMAEAGTKACCGQHKDLEYEHSSSVSERNYLNMIRKKSATLVECAARLGAILAGADGPTTDSLGRFGQCLGMAAQITNDAEAIGLASSRKGDITSRKKTLPVIFAMGYAEETDRDWLADVYSSQTPMDGRTEQRILDILRRSGAVHYSTVRAELFRKRAVKALADSDIPSAARQEIRLAMGI